MARKPRIHYEGAFYHTMLRGNNGNDIFFDNEDRRNFLSLLSECTTRFQCRIHAFCLMTNHVHLAIQVGEVPLAKIIQNVSFRYTRQINKRKDKMGHLFQGRYKAILVDADNYLLKLVQYIHLNPIRAQMVSRPEDYPWSSHGAYLNLTSYEWLTTSYILGYFSRIENHARAEFMKYINENTHKDSEINFDISNQKSFPAICDDAFIKKLEILQKQEIIKRNITLERAINIICTFYQVEESSLFTGPRKHSHTKIRAIIGWVALEFNICTLKQVAAHLNRDVTCISRILNQPAFSADYCLELAGLKEVIRNASLQA